MNPGCTRRKVLQASGAALVAPMINLGIFRGATGAATYSRRTLDLLQHSPVIDMLGALRGDLDHMSPAWLEPLDEQARAEFRGSALGVIHQSDGVGGPGAYEKALAYLAACSGFVGRNPEIFLLASKVADFDRARTEGRIAVFVGIQNAEHFRSVQDVRVFYGLGLRCAQLTYNRQNLVGAGCTERVDGGVTDFGAEIIGKMNEIGMLVDVSHCGDRTTLDAIEISKRPIAITHSNCRALNNHPRLKTDEAIRKLAAKGGVMGITGVRNFVRDAEPTTIEHIVDHIDHVVKLVGIEHVGIGTDSDLHGADDLPREQLKRGLSQYKASMAFRDKLDTDGFDDPRRFFNLTEALIRRGYRDDHIEAVLGGNFKRLLAAVQA